MNRRTLLKSLLAIPFASKLVPSVAAPSHLDWVHDYLPDSLEGELWIALYDGPREVSYGGYKRVRVARTKENWRYEPEVDLDDDGSRPAKMINTKPITFPECRSGDCYISSAKVGIGDVAYFDVSLDRAPYGPLYVSVGITPEFGPGMLEVIA